MLGRGEAPPCWDKLSITGTAPLGIGGEEGAERDLVGAPVAMETRGILLTAGREAEEKVPWFDIDMKSAPGRHGSLDGLSLVGVVASDEWAELVRVAMSLPVRFGAGMIMFLLTASGRGIWEERPMEG